MLIVAQSIADGEWRIVLLGTGTGVAAAAAFGSTVVRFALAGTFAWPLLGAMRLLLMGMVVVLMATFRPTSHLLLGLGIELHAALLCCR